MLKSDTMSVFADTIYQQKYAQEGETWRDTATRVVTNVSDAHFPQFTSELIEAIAARKFMPGGRYLYAAGKPNNQYNNCTLFDVEDSREGWGDLMNRVVLALTTGAGVGVCYSKLREEGAKIKGMGGESTGPLALMQMVNEAGRHIMQGGSRRAALYASLHWDHPDVFNFIAIKDWSDDVKAMKAKDFNFPAKMDGTNISVILDDEFFKAYHDPFYEPEDWRTKYTTQGSRGSAHEWAKSVYKLVIEHMLTTAEPGFQIDTGANSGEKCLHRDYQCGQQRYLQPGFDQHGAGRNQGRIRPAGRNLNSILDFWNPVIKGTFRGHRGDKDQESPVGLGPHGYL
jgi:ribonucleoside-diphosphate reductase alpha chain